MWLTVSTFSEHIRQRGEFIVSQYGTYVIRPNSFFLCTENQSLNATFQVIFPYLLPRFVPDKFFFLINPFSH